MWLPLAVLTCGVILWPWPAAAQAPGKAWVPVGGWFTPAPPFPAEASVRGEHGEGRVHVHTGADGRVEQARMSPSTGSEALDEASLRFVRAHWRGPANQDHRAVLVYRGRPPLEAYQVAVGQLIGQSWYESMKDHADVLQRGKAVVRFTLTSTGAVRDIRVLSARKDGMLVTVSLQAVRGVRLPPMPRAALAALPKRAGGTVDFSYTFTLQ